MGTQLIKFPETWKPENWSKHMGSTATIETDIDTTYQFSCHKVVKATPEFVTLYGQLDEYTAVQKWGERRYANIIIRDGQANMYDLAGPVNYEGGASFFV